MKKSVSNIALCGFMGCGKSTVGRLLAKYMGMNFIDTDTYIEKQMKMKIPAIFEQYGQDFFRRLERQSIKEICAKEGTVISLGGGTILNDENYKVLAENCKIVYIKATRDVLYKRLKNDKKRPLLQQGDKRKIIDALYTSREPIYASRADVSVASMRSIEDTATLIMHMLQDKRKDGDSCECSEETAKSDF